MTAKAWRSMGFVCCAAVVVLVGCVNMIVNNESKGQLYSNVNLIPKNKVGLLLGTAKFLDKARKIVNPFYQYRIDAAVALYMAGKIDVIIVSGDNSTLYYNEPVEMRNDLVAQGVPENHIYMDNAGFRTLDSVLRCRDIFGQVRFTIISQSFHNKRALYIARRKKLNCVAFNARDGDDKVDINLRELLARVKMMYDLLFNTQAGFYGEKIEIK